MNELKPCPFCGSKAEITETHEGDYLIWCLGCNAFMLQPTISREEAIKAWNKRCKDAQTD